MDHSLDTLRDLLKTLSLRQFRDGELSRPEAASLEESFRDCRLEVMRLESAHLTSTQLHRLQQMGYRLQMVASGQGSADGIAPEAVQALDSFGWSSTRN